MSKFNGTTTKTHFVNVLIREALFERYIENIRYEDTWDIAKYLCQKYPDKEIKRAEIKGYIAEWMQAK